MVKRTPYLFLVPVLVIAALMAGYVQTNSPHASLPISGNATYASFSTSDPELTSPLSHSDRELYRTIFRAQKKADWQAADRAIAELHNDVLLGHIYAERYLARSYKATPEELTAWLKRYSDHPQAYDLYQLAGARRAADLPTISKERSLQGYGDDNGLAASFGESKHAGTWQMALAKWRANKKPEAASLFVSMLKDDALPKWKKSAAAFWAYRCFDATGDRASAKKYLAIAAEEPRSFYGILARKQRNEPLGLESKPASLNVDERLHMLKTPLTQRVLALSETGRSDMAEKELRAAFPAASRDEKFRLLSLAYDLNLASAQIAMARQLASDERPLDFARYPIPHWQPQNGFKLDPALIYALVRQESGFRASAVSPVGALGLMQLMPQTASYIQKRMDSDLLRSELPEVTLSASDPTYNMSLGQHYVQHLLDNELVEGNLIYMLIAYNAGAGRLAGWKDTIAGGNDPLLFVESIPFAETRHYVMQVMTNYWIYSELAGNSSASVYALLGKKWPRYDIQAVPVATGSIQAIIENAS